MVTITGEKSFMAKAFCLFMSMDKMIGGKFETALAELRGIAGAPVKQDCGAGFQITLERRRDAEARRGV